jgi:hypothetical protein
VLVIFAIKNELGEYMREPDAGEISPEELEPEPVLFKKSVSLIIPSVVGVAITLNSICATLALFLFWLKIGKREPAITPVESHNISKSAPPDSDLKRLSCNATTTPLSTGGI